ncbi:cell division protein FtsQ/DivIB [Piscibacillus halophilus]|uniref:Cell division protein DivIB n=1 Tax=Piscibacillus halophilus TaxID=571933 RepID=A0A1H8YSU2_9BACI|nr:FtsQ-type POTRA domain-containing protein [Piscibacillus halophilus]SEP55250.1 cell division protein FtsQ [Piscibacillus halophilus]
MAEKKVVSIEDRIPQLKQLRKKKANRRFITYLTLILLLILVIVYLQSPLSHIYSVNVENNRVVDTEEIIELSELSRDQSFWSIDQEAVVEKIENHQEISDVTVNRSWYNQVTISVEEYSRVGYVKSSNLFKPILENGKVLDDTELKVPKGDAPVLYGFSEQEPLTRLTQQLAELDSAVVQLISEIYWEPEDTNKDQIRMFTTDGHEVIASIHNFKDKMKLYPSIAQQVTSDMEGILYIDVGAYFQPYNSNDEVELEASEEE